jgi:hypothetical protein
LVGWLMDWLIDWWRQDWRAVPNGQLEKKASLKRLIDLFIY